MGAPPSSLPGGFGSLGEGSPLTTKGSAKGAAPLARRRGALMPVVAAALVAAGLLAGAGSALAGNGASFEDLLGGSQPHGSEGAPAAVGGGPAPGGGGPGAAAPAPGAPSGEAPGLPPGYSAEYCSAFARAVVAGEAVRTADPQDAEASASAKAAALDAVRALAAMPPTQHPDAARAEGWAALASSYEDGGPVLEGTVAEALRAAALRDGAACQASVAEAQDSLEQ